METEPRRIHPVTFYDRQPVDAVKDGVADFRPYYQQVPLAARMGPPTHPGLRPEPEEAVQAEPSGDPEPESEPTEPEKKGPAPD